MDCGGPACWKKASRMFVPDSGGWEVSPASAPPRKLLDPIKIRIRIAGTSSRFNFPAGLDVSSGAAGDKRFGVGYLRPPPVARAVFKDGFCHLFRERQSVFKPLGWSELFGMQENELKSYEQLLIAKRDELLQSGTVGASENRGFREPVDSADQARFDSETELIERLRQTNSRLLRAIEEALERIKRGTFGVCTQCGQPIARPRLQAVPWTRLCLDCKEHRS